MDSIDILLEEYFEMLNGADDGGIQHRAVVKINSMRKIVYVAKWWNDADGREDRERAELALAQLMDEYKDDDS